MIVGDVDAFPAAERDELRAQDITSTLVLPIRVDDAWWGCIGFDECVRMRDWAGGEIEAMRAAAALLGAALTRQRQDAPAATRPRLATAAWSSRSPP